MENPEIFPQFVTVTRQNTRNESSIFFPTLKNRGLNVDTKCQSHYLFLYFKKEHPLIEAVSYRVITNKYVEI